MRYEQTSGVKKVEATGENRVNVTFYMDDEERDLFGAGKLRPGLVRWHPENPVAGLSQAAMDAHNIAIARQIAR